MDYYEAYVEACHDAHFGTHEHIEYNDADYEKCLKRIAEAQEIYLEMAHYLANEDITALGLSHLFENLGDCLNCDGKIDKIYENILRLKGN